MTLAPGQYGSVPYSSALNPSTPFSVEALANFSVLPTNCSAGTNPKPIFISRDYSNLAGYMLYADCYSAPQFAFIRMTASGFNYVYDTSGTVLQTSTWYHVIVPGSAAMLVNTTTTAYVGYCASCSGSARAGPSTSMATREPITSTPISVQDRFPSDREFAPDKCFSESDTRLSSAGLITSISASTWVASP